MRRITLTIPVLLSALVAGACDDGTPWSDGEETPTVESRLDFGPTAVYDRRILFLGPDGDLPAAAAFDFSSLADSAGVRGGVRARVLDGAEWATVADTGWALAPMREPWRIVPEGALRVLVNDAGEISALAARDSDTRLEPGTILSETSPDAGTQLILRNAELLLDGEPLPGVLLDAQLGRAVRPAQVPPRGDTAEAHPSTPIARPGSEALLVNSAGYLVVLTRSGEGDMAWVSHAGRDEIRRGVLLEPTAWTEPGEDGQWPSGWAVRGADADMAGELSTEAVDHSVLSHLAGVEGLDYVLVSGWIEDRGVRRDVFGLVRHVR